LDCCGVWVDFLFILEIPKILSLAFAGQHCIRRLDRQIVGL
jgi:hypothetical protein